MIIIKEHAYFELTPDIAKRLARYVLRQRSRQLKIEEKMGYNYLKISGSQNEFMKFRCSEIATKTL